MKANGAAPGPFHLEMYMDVLKLARALKGPCHFDTRVLIWLNQYDVEARMGGHTIEPWDLESDVHDFVDTLSDETLVREWFATDPVQFNDMCPDLVQGNEHGGPLGLIREGAKLYAFALVAETFEIGVVPGSRNAPIEET